MIKEFKAKEDFRPLYQKGDVFVIIRRNNDEWLMPIEAKRLKDGNIYGFFEEEIK